MVESVGKKLSQARLKRGLTVDEAAHATKLRPDKIVALENDDYSRFANNIYARGFLQIYARFLKVDASEFARTLDNANPISISDYQYLTNAPAPRTEQNSVRRSEERRAPSFAPLVGFVLLIILGLGGSWVWTTYQRIKSEEEARVAKASANAAGLQATAPTPNPDAAFINDPPRATAMPPSPTPGATALPSPGPGAATATPAPLGSATPAPAPGLDRDFVRPAPVAMGDPTAHPIPPGGVNEVLVATVKKTWVIVRKDDPKAAPIFEDYVYPNANPLKLKGARFYIEARDPASVQITKNGLPVAYQSQVVSVQ